MLYRFAVPAMACRFEVVIAADDAAWARSAAEEALAEVTLWHTRLNRFDKASDVARINQAARARPVRVDGELFELLSLCERATLVTGGMFNPLLRGGATYGTACLGGVFGTVAEGAGCAGFDDAERRTPPGMAVLRGAVLRGTVPCGPALVLDAAAGTVQIDDSDAAGEVYLDLGGIAKGWALDRAAESLVQSGVVLALLHGGTSSVRAIGTPPEMAGWAIQVGDGSAAQSPGAVAERLVVHLADESLSISAHHGRPGGHIVHPVTGRVVEPGHHAGPEMAVATCRSAAWAEVWSTALLLDPMLAPMLDPGLCAQGEQNATFEQARFVAVRNTCSWNVCSGSASGRTPEAISQLAAT